MNAITTNMHLNYYIYQIQMQVCIEHTKKVVTADIYDENIKETDLVKTLDIDYIEQSVKHSIVDNNQDLHYLYKQAPAGIILTIISALLVSWFVLPTIPDYIYIPWLTFIVLTAFTHTLIIKEFGKHKDSLQPDNQWTVYQTFMVGITGFAFSIGYLFFLPLPGTFSQVILLWVMTT